MYSKLGGYFTGAEFPLYHAVFLKDLEQNVLLQLVVYFTIQNNKWSTENPITLWFRIPALLLPRYANLGQIACPL